MSMTFPDKDQVREALADVRDLTDGSEPESLHTLAVVARAFVEGDLIPAEVDYEAAARRLANELALWGDVQFEAVAAGHSWPTAKQYEYLAHSILALVTPSQPNYEAAKRRFDEVYYGAPNNIEFVIQETVNAALSFQESGEK